MKCPLCGYEFQEEQAKTACKGCLMNRGCNMIKCPNCNYEIPAEPGLIKAFKNWKERRNGTGRKI